MSATPASWWVKLPWRYLVRHPWQTALMILGVTLGVAVVVAIDLANASASQAFDLSTDAITGRATHQILGGPAGLDEALHGRLKRAGIVQSSAPVISTYISSPQLGDRPLQLLGIDPFSDAPFRDFLAPDGQVSLNELTAFFTQPGAVLLSADNAARYGLQPGNSLTLEIGGQSHGAQLAGLLRPSDPLSERALSGLLLADIATVQELTGRIGTLDRIDLILPEGAEDEIRSVEAFLPPGIQLSPVEERSGVVAQMTAAFRVNLTALSLLALVVGMFLIYNTMTFSVLQRRSFFGTLRCLGVTRQEVFILVISEALVVGILSAVLGVLLGIALGRGAVRLVTQTINDLFFVVTVSGVSIPTTSLIKGAALGIIATVATAAFPAWEAAAVPPRLALTPSDLEEKARRAILWVAAGGGGLIAAGAAILALPSQDLTLGFTGTFAVIVGFALLTPLFARWFMLWVSPVLGLVWGNLGRMAPREVVNSLSRTAIAIAALMVAVSVIIGVSLMVGSFRYTVITWLDQTLQGDVYVTAPSLTATQTDTALDPAIIQLLRDRPEVNRVDLLRSAMVASPAGQVHIAAVNNPQTGAERLFQASRVSPDEIWGALRNGAVIVSEPFANRMGIRGPDSSVILFTETGPRPFPIVGVYYDYSSSQGTVMMHLDVYRRFWEDETITAAALRLNPGTDPDSLVIDLQETLAPVQKLLVRPNQSLRTEALAVFDRTFAITRALQMLATLVAFIGVLSALLSLQLEKQRQLGILRSIGLTIRQLWGLVMLETGLMGATAGLLAMPAGLALSLILIYIINRRSFGWTLQLNLTSEPFLLALFIAVAAALLAGIYPANKMAETTPADALRYE